MKSFFLKIKNFGIKVGSFFNGVVREGKRVRWPGRKGMLEDTTTVILFSAFFAAFFAIALTVVNAILTALGYIS